MARTTATPAPHQLTMSATRIPAAMDNHQRRRCAKTSASACTVPAISCGFTASTTTSAPATASRLSAVTCTPSSSASAMRRCWCASPTLMFCGGQAAGDEAANERAAHVAAADECCVDVHVVAMIAVGDSGWARAGRKWPCRCAPWSSPSAMAASKSALVPIDKRVEPQAALVEIVEHLAGLAKPLALARPRRFRRAACT